MRISSDNPDVAINIMEALADQSRRRILLLLHKNKDGVTASEIASFVNKSVPTVLHHLSLLDKLGLIHNKDIEEIFELKDESDGTKRLFDLIPLIEKFDGDNTIVIDEFDRSLHPKLTRKFVELFYSIENSKSQLVISTHESTLLNLELLRRDEIWFVEKDNAGASNISSLNQFKVRYDSKIEKAYLLGRYGAIPLFKTFDEMNLDK